MKILRLVLLIVIFSQCIGVAEGGSLDELYTACESFLHMLTTISNQWFKLFDETVDEIGIMADRILSTETLILDESDEIGKMADRILVTENLMKNLTQICLNCKKKSSDRAQPLRRDFEHKQGPYEGSHVNDRPSISFQSLFQNVPQLSTIARQRKSQTGNFGMVPTGSFFEFLNHTMQLIESMSGNVTNEIFFMETQIGVMADRILVTECLVMNMSQQIGVMADRIVATEYLMSNMTAKCCSSSKPLPTELLGYKRSFVATKPGPHCNTTTSAPFHDDAFVPLWKQSRQTESKFDRIKSSLLVKKTPHTFPESKPSVKKCAPYDFFCIEVEEMTKAAEKVEDLMEQVCIKMLKMMADGALEIGHLADDIVEMENQIINMGLKIGQISDSIVDCEKLMLQFAGKFCHLGTPRENLVAKSILLSNKNKIMTKEALLQIYNMSQSMLNHISNLKNIAYTINLLKSDYDRFEQELSNDLSAFYTYNPVRWAKLIKDILSTMSSMESSVVDSLDNIIKGVIQMASRIMTTVTYIEDMTENIAIMEGRIVKTAKMMQYLLISCA
ncbi:hypothetical protein M0812_00002 [Anaeramoeba flamelloides]|uniref:Uncharacterized protein n=1 Tax=Anaeramoeba flamelloides TaxID=1746091 RepID=A0AAV7ZZV4_9EUKA|nr:hypothetical protein M0812_00002 [Anaeramoeba flamelloides]